MTSSSAIVSKFISSQNAILSSASLALDYDQVVGPVPAGGNSVLEIAAVTATGTAVSLSGNGVVILDGAHSPSPAAIGSPDNFEVSIAQSGVVTLLDENTGNTETITGASYLIFNQAAKVTSGAFQTIMYIGGANSAEIIRLYEAALGRQPDLPGLAFYENQLQQASPLTFSQIATEFMGSPEFQAKYPTAAAAPDNGGPGDSAFVTQLYQNVLGRTPAASELSYYTAALQNSEAGAIINQKNPVAWSRATELVNFTASPEFQTINAGLVVDTSVGGYTDPGFVLPGSETALQALTALTAGGTINFNDITPASVTGVMYSNGPAALTSGGVVVNATQGLVAVDTPSLTIVLADSSVIKQAEIFFAAGDTVVGAPSGHSYVLFDGHGGTATLSGPGNSLIEKTLAASAGQTTNPLIVNGWASTDGLQFQHIGTTLTPVIDLLPQQSTPIVGGSGAITNASFGTTAYVVQTAAVSDMVLADLVKAATGAYTPSQTASGATTNNPQAIVFLAQDGGNTVAFHWTDNGQHQITVGTIDAVVELVGVAPMTVAGTLLP